MKLISCYIENFGGLHQKQVQFNEGLTVVEEPNGSGKTTLATFVRCMLYGMPRRVRDLGKDLRRRYEPWQGGAFGGQLTLWARGREYRIERTFGATPREDTLVVYDVRAGRAVNDLGAVPGITLFGLDADSFERSAYLPQNQLVGALATTDIKAKLGNLVENTDGVHNFESAMKLLRNARAAQVSFRGEAGAYYDLTAQISQVNEEMTQLTTAEGELQRVSARAQRIEQTIDERRAALDEVRESLAGAAGAVARRGLALECKRLDDERKAAKALCQQLGEQLPQGAPSEEELNELFAAERTLELAKQAGLPRDAIEENLSIDAVEPPAPKSAVPTVLLVLGALLLVAGAALAGLELAGVLRAFAGQLYAGAGAAVVGLTLVVAGAVLSSKQKTAAVMAAKPKADLLKQSQDAYRAVLLFCETYGFEQEDLTHDGLLQVWNDAQGLRRANQASADAQQAFDNYVAEHGLCAWSREDEDHYRSLNVEELRQQENALMDALDDALQHHAKDAQRVQTLQERVQRIPQLQEQLQTLMEKRKKAGKDAATLDATMAYLQQARDEISADYTDVVQERFRYYLQLLLGSEMGEAQIDANFGISYSQAGATRSLESLSAGYADLVVVCMRMALCDALYTKEQPFVIMDDPFINVDDELMGHGFALLDKLAANRQVVYFTCSSSRNPFSPR